MKVFAPIKAHLRQFAEDTRATIAIEAMLVLPMIFWAYCAMFTYFDAYRQVGINQKAAYTMADLLSRETNPIDDSYMDNVQNLFDFLTRSHDGTAIRLTVIKYDADQDQYKVDWSKTRGNTAALTTNITKNWEDRLPIMPDDERLILLETRSTYSAPFTIGLDDRPISTFVFTRPRFAPQLLWTNG